MSRYGCFEVFQRVAWTSRQRESDLFLCTSRKNIEKNRRSIIFKMGASLRGKNGLPFEGPVIKD